MAACTISFIIWWCCRYHHRRANQVVVTQVQPAEAMYPTVIENTMGVPAGYPGYPPPLVVKQNAFVNTS